MTAEYSLKYIKRERPNQVGFQETLDCRPPVGKDLIFSDYGRVVAQVSRSSSTASRSSEVFMHTMLPGCRRIIPALGDGNGELRCGDPYGSRYPGAKAICLECFEAHTNQVGQDQSID